MTPEPDHPERDPALDSAWREHSAEMPPARLDAAILAAAHRAAGSAPRGIAPRGSAPQDSGKQAAEATSPQRWWMPLAAAATIGAVAVGILQSLPQEQPVTTPSVSDLPARSAERANALPSAPSTPADTLTATARKEAPPDRQLAQEYKDEARAAATSDKQQIPAPGVSPMALSKNVPAAAAPQPFPAEKKREMADSADFKDQGRAASAAAPGAPPSTELARPSPVAQLAPSPPPAAAPAPASMPTARADFRRQDEAAAPAPAASGAVTMAKTMARVEAPSAPAVDVEAWIIRIRKLHDEGKLADAAKELVALRAAFPEADRRLPPELRAWAATVKP